MSKRIFTNEQKLSIPKYASEQVVKNKGMALVWLHIIVGKSNYQVW